MYKTRAEVCTPTSASFVTFVPLALVALDKERLKTARTNPPETSQISQTSQTPQTPSYHGIGQ
jgi:hypothetical protein